MNCSLSPEPLRPVLKRHATCRYPRESADICCAGWKVHYQVCLMITCLMRILLSVLNCCLEIPGRLDFNYCFETKHALLETLQQAWVHRLGPARHKRDGLSPCVNTSLDCPFIRPRKTEILALVNCSGRYWGGHWADLN